MSERIGEEDYFIFRVKTENVFIQETIGAQAKQWKSLTNRATVKEKYKGAQGFLERIKSLVEDVSKHKLQYYYLF